MPGISELKVVEQERTAEKEGFQVCLDVQHFRPNEISVRTENNNIFVYGKHGERRDEHGLVSREFTRRYLLSDGFKIEEVTSTLSFDGVLCIRAPSSATSASESKVRHIPIQQTGPAATSISKNEEPKAGEDKKDDE